MSISADGYEELRAAIASRELLPGERPLEGLPARRRAGAPPTASAVQD